MKYFLFIMVLLVHLARLDAQVRIGFQVGVNDSKAFLHFNEAPNVFVQSRYPVPLLSLFVPVELELKPHFSFISGLQYVEAGNNLLLKTDMFTNIVSNRVQFLKVPVGVKLELDLKLFSLNGLGGGYVSKIVGVRQNGDVEIDAPTLGRPNFTDFDVGIWAGCSIERLLANSIKMHLTFRRNIGLKNISKSRGEGLFMDSTETALGLIFPFKKKTVIIKKARI